MKITDKRSLSEEELMAIGLVLGRERIEVRFFPDYHGTTKVSVGGTAEHPVLEYFQLRMVERALSRDVEWYLSQADKIREEDKVKEDEAKAARRQELIVRAKEILGDVGEDVVMRLADYLETKK